MLHSTVIHGGVLLYGSNSWVEYNINSNEFTFLTIQEISNKPLEYFTFQSNVYQMTCNYLIFDMLHVMKHQRYMQVPKEGTTKDELEMLAGLMES